jgi:anti-sigma B factor antagonist
MSNNNVEIFNDAIICLNFNGKIIQPLDITEELSQIDFYINSGFKYFILNLEKVSYINSFGINAFIKILTSVRSKGGELIVVSMAENVEKVFAITKLNSIFKICADIESAKHFFYNKL